MKLYLEKGKSRKTSILKTLNNRGLLPLFMKKAIIEAMEESGILLIDKPAGKTSRQVDNAIGKIFHTRKVGHLGTLDPFATGLLVVGVNKGNKFLPYLGDEVKTYRASLKLGNQTSTGDLTGEIINSSPIPPLDESKIDGVLQSFLGKSLQLPPMTSAIKINGTALYKFAHKGEEVERSKREIEIYEIHLCSFDCSTIEFETTVSSGTYIRVLGEDIAFKLGTLGHLTALRRIQVGEMKIEDATPLEDIDEGSLLNPTPYLHLPKMEVDEGKSIRIRNGMKMKETCVYPRVAYLFQNEAIAIYERQEDGLYHCLRGLK